MVLLVGLILLIGKLNNCVPLELGEVRWGLVRCVQVRKLSSGAMPWGSVLSGSFRCG